jgi:signal transduction histidine kinase
VVLPTPRGGEIVHTVATPTGELTITASAPVEQAGRSADLLAERLTVWLPLLVVLVGLIVWVVVGRALRPVEAIRAEVERIGGSTMHRRVPEPATGDEVGRLARTMNTMLGRLEASAARQRRFVADASHELRSPVAVLRAGLEVARTRTDPATWPATIDALLEEEARLESLLDDLLLLAAHDEAGAPPPRTTRVDLAALAEAEARRPHRVPVIVGGVDDDVPVTGSPDHLARALRHVVDNATRHARSRVRITVEADGRAARLVVDDDGPGIPPADRERVFERFTRLDDARTRTSGGTGLGLAVTASILHAHHGTITATPAPTPFSGARLTLTLPRAEAP